MRFALIPLAFCLALPAHALPREPLVVAVGTFSGKDRELADVVHETLITELAESERLQVVEAGSAGARCRIVGSCLPLNGLVVINARVVDVRSGRTLPGAAENAAGAPDSLFSLVHSLAARLSARIGGVPPVRATAAPARRPAAKPSAPPARLPLPMAPGALRSPARLPAPAPSRPAEPRERQVDARAAFDEDAGSGYTCLIVDARGLGLERSMSPRIRREDGSTVWAGEEADPDFVNETGIVAYASSIREAHSNRRAGSAPLVLRATGVHANAFRSDPTLSDEDADFLLERARRDGFLRRFRVIFVVDGPGWREQ